MAHNTICSPSLIFIVFLGITHDVIHCQNLRNVALGKPALGDSMYTDTSISQPRYAVDGRRQTNVWHYTCFHSSDYYWIYDPNWWIVDLLQDYTIHQVIITNRDQDSHRLADFTIDIFTGSQDPRTYSGWPDNQGTVCWYQLDAVGSSETRTFTCNAPTVGRYVRVVKYGYYSLVMCEVQVMAPEPEIILLPIIPGRGPVTSLSKTSVSATSLIECYVRCAQELLW